MKFFAVFFFIFAMSCTKIVIVNTVPPGAKVYVEEKYIGVSPTSVEANTPPYSGSKLRLEKEGYFPEHVVIPIDPKVTKMSVNLEERGKK